MQRLTRGPSSCCFQATKCASYAERLLPQPLWSWQIAYLRRQICITKKNHNCSRHDLQSCRKGTTLYATSSISTNPDKQDILHLWDKGELNWRSLLNSAS